MTWNHRVIRHDDKPGNPEYIWFAVHECFYLHEDDEIPDSWTTEAIAPIEDNIESLIKTIERYKECLSKPILEIDGNKLRVWKPE